eukprot:scaffold363_cov255-Pinguiococcus_pyrenoidosus.AAC.17
MAHTHDISRKSGGMRLGGHTRAPKHSSNALWRGEIRDVHRKLREFHRRSRTALSHAQTRRVARGSQADYAGAGACGASHAVLLPLSLSPQKRRKSARCDLLRFVGRSEALVQTWGVRLARGKKRSAARAHTHLRGVAAMGRPISTSLREVTSRFHPRLSIEKEGIVQKHKK